MCGSMCLKHMAISRGIIDVPPPKRKKQDDVIQVII